jgi:hypothetical protein
MRFSAVAVAKLKFCNSLCFLLEKPLWRKSLYHKNCGFLRKSVLPDPQSAPNRFFETGPIEYYSV